MTEHTPKKGQKEHSRGWVQNRNCTLSVLSLLKAGVRPAEIWKNHEFTKRQVKYVLRKLKDSGVIRKLGYGTWEVLDPQGSQERRYKIIHRVTPGHSPTKGPIQPDSVRGHGIVATVRIPSERFINWEERHIVLEARDIPYKEIPQGQRIEVGDVKKVWITNKSLVYYLPYSWYGDTAPEVAEKILQDVIGLVMRTEKMLGIDNLKINGYYRIKFSRQHYSLIRNGLAKLYNKDPRRKLQVRDEGGLWLLIDNSYNLEELEAVHPETAQEDNKHVQDFFNSLKKAPITTEFILERFADTATQIKDAHGQLAMYAKNLKAHVESVQELGHGVRELTHQATENAKTTTDLRDAVQRLAEGFKSTTIPIDLLAKLPEHAVKRLEEREIRVSKICSLCGAKASMPAEREICDACEKITSKYKKKRPRTGTLRDYYE